MIFKLKRREETIQARKECKDTHSGHGGEWARTHGARGGGAGRGGWAPMGAGWRGWGMGTTWSHWRRGDGHPRACVGGGPGVAPAGGALGCGPSTCCPSPCITTLCRDGNICELSLQEADIKSTMRKNGVDYLGNKKGTAWHLIKQISINDQF